MRRWFLYFLGGRSFSGSNRRWWAGIFEALAAVSVLFVGVILFVISVTLAVINWSPEQGLYISGGYFAIQLLVAALLVAIGGYFIARLMWHIGISAERRGAFTSRANEMDLFNEFRKRREDLPSVPRDHFAPKPGQSLAFRLSPSPRNVWGLLTSGLLSIVFVAIVTVLAIIVATSFGFGSIEWNDQLERQLARNQLDNFSSRPWLAVAWFVPICLAAGWSIYQFSRQLLKLTGIGPTSIEVSAYPLTPGKTYQVSLSQAGRVRLKLLDVSLVCQEEATFNEGTDVRTERAQVWSQRLFRQRGITLSAGKPFETEFELAIPDHAMHSFKSPNNRVLWKIVVTGQAKSWPRLERKFSVSVNPKPPLETPPTTRQ